MNLFILLVVTVSVVFLLWIVHRYVADANNRIVLNIILISIYVIWILNEVGFFGYLRNISI
jgi:hypothetical protein